MFLKFVCENSQNELNVAIDNDFGSDIEDYKYSYYISIKVFDIDAEDIDEEKTEGLNLVAIIEARLFNIDEIENDGEDLIDIADRIDQETYENIYELFNSKIYDEDRIYQAHACYLERFYVMPDYRKKGIGKYLLENLSKILKYQTNADIRYTILQVVPLNYTNDKWQRIKKCSEMKNFMKSMYEKAGFKQIKKSNYFAKIDKSF